MSFFKFSPLRKKGRQNRNYFAIVICIFFILLFILNFLNFSNLSDWNDIGSEDIYNENDSLLNYDQTQLEIATDISMLQNPFIENFESIRNFFLNKYDVSINNDIPLYFRKGDSNGTITDDSIYSEDNLRMYYSLMQSEITPTETFNIYLDLKSTPFWYENSNGQFDYGFVKSVDNSTGEVKDDERYLINNLLPIFLLVENIDEEIDDIIINGKYPQDSIEEMFSLINSTEFWDETYEGFDNSNSTNNKYSESNFYAILANLLIHRMYDKLALDEIIKNRAYDLANKTIYSIVNNMWDTDDKGFYHDANRVWDTSIPGIGHDYYHLDVNALGIITLLEFWVSSGMKNDSPFLLKAFELYNSLDLNLWNDTDKLYHNVSQPNWNIIDFDYDLNANALMLEACIRFFQLTGNITYYHKAIELFNSFESNLYDNTIGAYYFSLTDSSKNFKSNIMLFEAYLKASETYGSTILDANYNLTAPIPDYIFNQDTMNLTSLYSYKDTETYYDLTSESYIPFTIRYNITDFDINYIFKYPNGTFLYQLNHQVVSPDDSHNLIHTIQETLPIGDGYFIYIWANTTYFSLGDTIKRFNVVSGLINEPIEGLVSLLYQGPILNITLPINYTRKDNLTLMASLEGENIKNFAAQEVNFTENPDLDEYTYINFNLTARAGAIPGPSEIIFKIYKDKLIYLEVKREIEIGYSFDFEHLLYQTQVVAGENFNVYLNLINFLPNATQSLNVSFSGITNPSIEYFIQEEVLSEEEVRSVSYSLKTLENIINDTIMIEMNILQNTTIYYTEMLFIEIIPRFDILSVSFPTESPQGAPAYFIAIVKNNLEHPEEFTLFINGKVVKSNKDELIPGENRIIKRVVYTTNPYEFGEKTFEVIIKDSKNDDIARFYFEITIELSTFNLIFFYIVPIIIPVGIILYFLNRQLKHKKLRR